MAELASGTVVKILAPGTVKTLWLKEGPAGPTGLKGDTGDTGATGAPGTTIVSIVRTAGDGSSGSTDTYTITYSDATTSTFQVYNGTDGTGTGDVTGPASSVNNRVALFSGTTGKVIKDSGVILGDAAAKNTGTTAGTVAAGDDTRITGAAQKSANLSDLADAPTARTNLGLGTAATKNTGTASGDIPLLSTGGRLPIARIASGTPDGTKFVRDDGTLVTPSGGGGGATLLARKVHNPASATTYTSSSASPTDVDATNLAATFTVPATGKVRIYLAGFGASGGGLSYWSLRNGSTDVPGSERCVTSATGIYITVGDIVITGLTPGAAVTYKWAYRRASGSAYLQCGGTEFSSTSYNGPAIMEVWSEA